MMITRRKTLEGIELVGLRKRLKSAMRPLWYQLHLNNFEIYKLPCFAPFVQMLMTVYCRSIFQKNGILSCPSMIKYSLSCLLLCSFIKVCLVEVYIKMLVLRSVIPHIWFESFQIP